MIHQIAVELPLAFLLVLACNAEKPRETQATAQVASKPTQMNPSGVAVVPAPTRPYTPEHPLFVEGFFNMASGCMQTFIGHLRETEKKSQGRLKFEVTDFSAAEGQAKMQQRGLHCLTILVDGENQFLVKDKDGKDRTVLFQKPPEYGNWKFEDLDYVLDKKLDPFARTPESPPNVPASP